MSSIKAPGPSAASLAPMGSRFETEHRGHVVQFYTDDEFLLTTLGRYVGTALGAGDSAVVIATKEHRDALEHRLAARGLNTAEAARQGRYIALDAAEILSRFMRNGKPDPALFAEIIGGVIQRAEEAGEHADSRVVAFGEMVALLWERNETEAAVQLERLWNDLARTHAFALLCACRMGTFDREEDSALFLKVCEEHSSVIPSESYTALASEAERLRNIAVLQQREQAFQAELALAQSEERYHRLVESVEDYAIFMLDPDGYVATWNTGAERIKGYRAEEVIGRHFSCFYPEEDVKTGKPQRALGIAAKDGHFEEEGGWRVRKDGSRFWGNVVLNALRDKDGNLRGFSKVTRDITPMKQAHEALENANKELRKEVAERRETEKKLHQSERNLRQLSARLLRMQDEERRHLGRELHDSIGQYLATLKMGLDSLKADVRVEEIARRLEECIALAEQSINEVRTASYLLYPPMLEELGLYTAISWYLDGFAKRSGIRTMFEMPSNLGRLPREVELAVFRVLQESVTNVHRHSGSQTAQVRLWLENGTVHMEVKDQGHGIPAKVLESMWEGLGTLGVGLRGMSERLQQLGGALKIDSTEKGTTVRATVPCDEEVPSEEMTISA